MPGKHTYCDDCGFVRTGHDPLYCRRCVSQHKRDKIALEVYVTKRNDKKPQIDMARVNILCQKIKENEAIAVYIATNCKYQRPTELVSAMINMECLTADLLLITH